MIIFQLITLISALIDFPGVKDDFDALKKRRFDWNSDSEIDTNYFQGNDSGASASSADVRSDNNTVPRKIRTKDMPIVPETLNEVENRRYIEDLAKKLNEELGLEREIMSIANEKAWAKAHDYLEHNLHLYLVDGELSIELHIRYFLCTYIVLFIPGEVVFCYPAFWSRLVPDIALKVDILREGLEAMRMFQDFVKEKGEHSFLISFYIARGNSLWDDLKFMLNIPFMLLSDFPGLIRELLNFKIKSEGYEDFKKANANKKYW